MLIGFFFFVLNHSDLKSSSLGSWSTTSCFSPPTTLSSLLPPLSSLLPQLSSFLPPLSSLLPPPGSSSSAQLLTFHCTALQVNPATHNCCFIFSTSTKGCLKTVERFFLRPNTNRKIIGLIFRRIQIKIYEGLPKMDEYKYLDCYI